jgi:hypothetical protein
MNETKVIVLLGFQANTRESRIVNADRAFDKQQRRKYFPLFLAERIRNSDEACGSFGRPGKNLS